MDNKAFWGRFARRYDAFMRHFSPEYSVLIQRISRDVGDAQRIVEVATGTGLIALELGGSEWQIDAIDISPVMIACAQEKAHAREALGDRAGLATSYNNIGLIYDARGDYGAALCRKEWHRCAR